MSETYKNKTAMIWHFLKGGKALFLMAIVFTAVTALADMLIPQIVKLTVDHVIARLPADNSPWVQSVLAQFGGAEYLRRHLWIPAAAIVCAASVKVASQYSFRVCNAKASETFVKNTRDTLFSHIERLPYAWHMKNHTGDIIQRCTSDIDTMKEFVSEEMTSLFRILILLTFSIGFMFSMNVRLAVIAMVPIPLIVLNSVIFDRKIEEGFSAYDENEGKLSAMVQENLTGVRVVRAFGREREEQERFHRQNIHYTRLAESIGKNIGIFWGCSDVLTGIQSILVICFGAYFCLHEALSAGELIAFLSYNGILAWPLTDLGSVVTQLGKTGIAINRIHYIMKSEPERDKPDALKPDMNGDICFDHVNFAYDNCAEILHDVSFQMKAGTTLGILGGTGSGKTTLMLLLDKLYSLPENSGTISVGGVDIRNIDTQYLRRNIGIVLQDPYLFSRTLAENIAIADDDLTLPQIRQAAADACLDDTIQAFSKGYDTFVGERGVTLSGGQKQRTAIARVLIQPSPILIFDDSMSAVDTNTDAKIQKSLEARFGSASIIIISHRISSISHADQILVLDRGTVAERGTHEELIAANGIYRKIYDIQTDREEEKQ